MAVRSCFITDTSASTDFGSGLGEAFARALGKHAQRIEARDVGRVDAARERKVRGDAHERPDPDDLAVAGALGDGRAERLLCDRDHFRAHELVALAGDRLGASFRSGRARCDGDRVRELGERGLPLQRDVDGAADQGGARDPGEDAGAEPAQVDGPAVDLAGAAGGVQRRLVADVARRTAAVGEEAAGRDARAVGRSSHLFRRSRVPREDGCGVSNHAGRSEAVHVPDHARGPGRNQCASAFWEEGGRSAFPSPGRVCSQ